MSDITFTEDPTVHETSWGSRVYHAVAVDGKMIGWVVEHRTTDGETLGWGVWGDQDYGGLFSSRDAAAEWIAENL